MKQYEDKYSELLNLVENRLNGAWDGKQPESVYGPVSYIMSSGGKRIRPVLAMACCGACSGKPEDALEAGAALEILHNFTLAHDDIMDKSPYRRGRPTVHTKWNDAVGIIAGDLMAALGYGIILENRYYNDKPGIARAFTEAYIDVCEGQAFDMQFNEKKDVSKDDYIQMIAKKTSSLLIAGARMGAYAANAPEPALIALGEFARNLGLAFQLNDDLLDLTASPEKLGKKPGLDIIEGKKTFLILDASEKAENEEDRNLIKRFFDENGLPESEVQAIKELMLRLGVFENSAKEAEAYNAAAIAALENVEDGYYKDMLKWLAGKLLKRAY